MLVLIQSLLWTYRRGKPNVFLARRLYLSRRTKFQTLCPRLWVYLASEAHFSADNFATSSPPRTPRINLEFTRYLKRSRREIMGVCLPFGLFNMLNIGLGVFRFLVAPPIYGMTTPRFRQLGYSYVEAINLGSFLFVGFLLHFMTPKLVLLYQCVASCFVWFGLAISVFRYDQTLTYCLSVSRTEKKQYCHCNDSQVPRCAMMRPSDSFAPGKLPHCLLSSSKVFTPRQEFRCTATLMV